MSSNFVAPLREVRYACVHFGPTASRSTSGKKVVEVVVSAVAAVAAVLVVVGTTWSTRMVLKLAFA